MVCSGRSRFSDKGGGGGGGGGGAAGHPDPEIRGSPVSKKIFPALQASVRSKNKAAPPPSSPPLEPPLVCVESILILFLCYSSFGRKKRSWG